MVFQNANLFEWLTVEENIAFGLRATRTYDAVSYTHLDVYKRQGLTNGR